MKTPRQQLADKYPGHSIIAGPYKIEQPMLPQLAEQQRGVAASAFLARRKTDPAAKLVSVGRSAYIITQKKRATVNKNELVASNGLQVKAGRGGWK